MVPIFYSKIPSRLPALTTIGKEIAHGLPVRQILRKRWQIQSYFIGSEGENKQPTAKFSTIKNKTQVKIHAANK
jgi:hypothetical protein